MMFITPRRTKRIEADYVIEVFKELEMLDGKLYKSILSYEPLMAHLIRHLRTIYTSKEQKIPEGLAANLNQLEKLLVSGAPRLLKKENLIDDIVVGFYVQDAAKDWQRFCAVQMSNPQTIRDTFDIEFDENDPNYLNWRKQVRKDFSAMSAVKDDFVTQNQGLVARIAKPYSRGAKNYTMEDLIQEGSFGLLKSVDRFDYKRGIKFSTYASWWIRHNIARALTDKDVTIRVPVHIMDKVKKAKKLSHIYKLQNGVAPSMEYIAQEMNISVKQATDIMSSTNVVFSMDAKMSDEGDDDFYNVHPDIGPSQEEVYLKKTQDDQLHSALSQMTEREKFIIWNRFGVGRGFARHSNEGTSSGGLKTLDEVGQQFNLSRERIRQIEAEALKKIKTQLVQYNTRI